jgi:hypothetical protein
MAVTLEDLDRPDSTTQTVERVSQLVAHSHHPLRVVLTAQAQSCSNRLSGLEQGSQDLAPDVLGVGRRDRLVELLPVIHVTPIASRLFATVQLPPPVTWTNEVSWSSCP